MKEKIINLNKGNIIVYELDGINIFIDFIILYNCQNELACNELFSLM